MPDLTQQVRAFRWKRQELGAAGKATAAEVIENTGWMRSVGGVGPYLGLFARAGISREQADADVAALKIHELPAARGCTYVVPAADFALALRAGQGFASDYQVARKHLGVTEKEIEKLCGGIAKALSGAPLDPAQLKDELGGAVRNLGEAGKKRGVTTTLPVALGLLQSRGEIRRVPVNGRLDQQRYRYVRWSLRIPGWSDEDVAVELARRYFRWAAPATVGQFQWWAGLGAKAAKAAVAELKLAQLDESQWMFDDDLDALRAGGTASGVALVSSLDNLFAMRRELASLLDRENEGRIPRGGARAGGGLMDLPSHAVVARGTIAGLWEFDAGKGGIVRGLFGKATPEVDKAVKRTETFIREQLGDARSFSLDSPESRGPRIAALRHV